MGLASQCEGRFGSDFPTFAHIEVTILLAEIWLPRCSPAWGHSRNQNAKMRGDATTLLASVGRWLRPNDYAFKITYNSISTSLSLM
jgi:hypothetical protein